MLVWTGSVDGGVVTAQFILYMILTYEVKAIVLKN